MANPAPNPNPKAEIDAAVESSVKKFAEGKGADAVVDINKLYDKHSNDAVFRAQFTGELTKGLQDKGLLPAAADELFGIKYEHNGRQYKVKHNGFSRLDLNGDFKVDNNELAKFLSNKSLKSTLTPFEQQMVGYLQVNKDTIAGKDNDITPGRLHAFAQREQERERENRVAGRILADPKGFHDRYTTDQYISEDAINKDLDFCNKMANFPGLNAAQLKDIEARKETGEYLLKHRSEMSTGTGKWFSDNASQDSLVAWAQRTKEQNRETVPAVELVGKDVRKGLDAGQAGWMPDLISRYASPRKNSDGGGGHFDEMALSGAGDGKRIMRGDLSKYLQVNPDLTPFEKKIVNNMITHYNEIAGASGLNSASEGISIADLSAYSINQGKIRDEEAQANKVVGFLNNPKNYGEFADKSSGRLTQDSLQHQIDAANASLAGLKAIPDAAQTDATRAQIAALESRKGIADYLSTHYSDIHTFATTGLRLSDVQDFVNEKNKRHALDEFVDAQGNKSTPAAAKAAEAAKVAEAAKKAPVEPVKDRPADPAGKEKVKEPPPDENGKQLRKLIGLPEDATDKQVSDKMSADNAASLRKSLGLPADATDKQVSDKMSADNSAALRKSLGLPADATDKQVSDKMSADNSAALRKSLGLPADATDKQVSDKMSADNSAALRKSLGLPADATDKQVSDKMSADNSAALRKSLGLPPDAPDKQTDERLADMIAGRWTPPRGDQPPVETATVPEAVARPHWDKGLQALDKKDYATAEKELREARKGYPINDKDFAGNQVAVDLTEAILKNPDNAKNYGEKVLADYLLARANKFFKAHEGDAKQDEFRKNVIKGLLTPEAEESKAPVKEKPKTAQDLEIERLEKFTANTLEWAAGVKDATSANWAGAEAHLRKAYSGFGPGNDDAHKVAGDLAEAILKNPANAKPPELAKAKHDEAVKLLHEAQDYWKTHSDDPIRKRFVDQFLQAEMAKDAKPGLGKWPEDLGKKPESKLDAPEKKKEPEKKEDDWDKYIRENVREKGGFAGASQYGAAREEAARSGKELVVVVGSRNQPQMLQGVANALLQGEGNNRVYLYLDQEKVKSDPSEFAAYVNEHLPVGSAKAYRVWQQGDNFTWQEQYGIVNFGGGGAQYNPQPRQYQSEYPAYGQQPGYYQPYQPQCQPQYQYYQPQRRFGFFRR